MSTETESTDIDRGHELALERLDATAERLADGTPWRAEALATGLTNRTWAVRLGDEPVPSFVVQVLLDDAAARAVGIDRTLQFAAAEVGSTLGIAPGLVRYDAEQAVSVTEFFAGVMFGDAGPARRSVAVREVGRALRLLHAAPAEPRFASPSTAPVDGSAALRARAQAANAALSEEFAWAMAPIDLVARHGDRARIALTHNDLITGNILVGDGIRLIDWEYSGLGDPYSDLGDFAGKCELSPAEERELLDEYCGAYDPVVHAWLRVYRVVNVVREALWGIAMTRIGKAETDYEAYVRFRFAQTGEYLQTPEYRWAAETLAAHDRPFFDPPLTRTDTAL